MTLISSILEAASLVASLPQEATNGASVLGTLNASYLPPFLTNNPLPHGYPWGDTTAEGTSSHGEVPYTGVTRSYNWEISRGTLAPDGLSSPMMLINGQFPGPTIEANWGDTIQVTVKNNILSPTEGTSVHWHGLLQKDTPWFDGVPSVSQCPIAPNRSFTYKFQADVYGTSWYHSHYSAQYADGILGAMIIYGPQHAKYDHDLGPIILSDHFHTPYYEIVQAITGKSTVTDSDNNLINGKMNYDCSLGNTSTCVPNAGVSKFKFVAGKVHRLRLINSGAEGLQKFTIDNHTMTVIANDFVPIKPYDTNVVTLGVGQRSDVLVHAHGNPKEAFWMRSEISVNCSHTNQPLGLAAVYYQDADTNSTPKSTATSFTVTNCTNDAIELTEPLYRQSPPLVPAHIQDILIDFSANDTGAMVWKMNNVSFRANYDHPILLLANEGNTSYPDDPQWNVFDFGRAKSARLIVRQLQPLSHPMHLHGHNFWVVAEGRGTWDGKVQRPHNPQRRDTQILDVGDPYHPTTAESYIVLDFIADNPGVWPFHCHVAWHVSDGLYLNILERPGEISDRQIPLIMAQTCIDWADYSAHNVVNEIDSGE